MDILSIRDDFGALLDDKRFVIDKSGVKTIEIVGSSFTIKEDDEDKSIFGSTNHDYVERELEWYLSGSLYVKDIPGKTPAIWEQVASVDGKINSNYGHLVFSHENYDQYANVVETLSANPYSRRGTMIYTRPIMHYDYNRDGMSDFICTNTVQYLIRDEKIHAIVNMRSNDAVFGFKNDYHWQRYVLGRLARDLGVEVGDIHWQAASLHVYERHFYLVRNWWDWGIHDVSKEEFRSQYPDFEYTV